MWKQRSNDGSREDTEARMWKSSSARLKMAFWYWFTFVTHPGVAPTNNRAEKAQIAGHVEKRWIVGTLRNRKGTSIHERIMTMLATCTPQGRRQSPDDEGKAERLNTYYNEFPDSFVLWFISPVSNNISDACDHKVRV